ncbi:unnamed protein product [Brassica rapa]|uniref:Uncharacterized protein n=1 Tax=Brassica campestris TaxID=3711 RepID=A0A8D9GSC4_BRACM|nr:unnamed protein product [Brassica rapa]
MFEADQRRLFSQFEVREFCDNLVEDFEEKPFDYPHQEPLLGTKRPMDVDLYPIFDEKMITWTNLVSPSDDATMVEPEANLEKKGLREWMQPYRCISVDATPMEGTKWKQQSIDLEDIMELDTHEHFGRVRRSDTYLGELVELNQSDTYISELDELSELSDSSLELNELSDTKDGAGLAVKKEYTIFSGTKATVTTCPADPRFHRSIGHNLSCGELLKGEVLDSSNVKRINNLPVDVEAVPPTVRG